MSLPSPPGLTPLDTLGLSESLLAMCRQRQIVTVEQVRDLIEDLLREPAREVGDPEELHAWLDRIDGLIGVQGKPPEHWTPTFHPIGGVLPSDERQDDADLEGLRPLFDGNPDPENHS